MTDTAAATITMAELPGRAGTHLGYTDWQEMTQEQVNQFADLTDDHNYIHVDVERAKESPFGGTIAHGFLTLSLLAPVTQQLLRSPTPRGHQLRPRPGPLSGAAAGRLSVAGRRRDRRGRREPRRPPGHGAGHDRGRRCREAGAGGGVADPPLRLSARVPIDISSIVAIDVHTHAERNPGEPQDPVTTEVLEAAARYFGGSPPQPTAQEVADYYREREHGRGDVHRRRRGGHGPQADRQRRRARRGPRPTPTC